MKNLFFLSFILQTPYLLGQIGISENTAIISELRICQMISYTTDSLGEKYLSGILRFDSYGREIHNQNYNKDGEVISEDNTRFISDSVELTVYHEDGYTDTAICIYDQLNRPYYEYWYWGEEKESEETFYTYRGYTDMLICIRDKYSWGEFTDSSFYENEKLLKRLMYDSENGLKMKEIYNYENDLLLSVNRFNVETNKPIMKIDYSYSSEGLMLEEKKQDFEFSKQTNTSFTYHENGTLKEEIIEEYVNNALEKTALHAFDDNGLRINTKYTNTRGKTTEIEYTYLSSEECNKIKIR